MDREGLLGQYDRFLEQVRTEAKDLYWLFNFFFVIQSALLVSALTDRFDTEYRSIAEVTGFLIALYWFLIVRKQRLWRNYWVTRIQAIEGKLDMPSDLQMWPPKTWGHEQMAEFVIGRRGVWRLLFVLPIGFAVLWAFLFFRI